MERSTKMRLAARAARDSGVLSSVDDDSLENAYLPLAERLASSAAGHGPSPLTFGIVGGPGAGKSTLSEYLGVMLEAGYDLKVARFGLDDVYLSKEARRELGQRVHPLLSPPVFSGPTSTGFTGTQDPTRWLPDAVVRSTTVVRRALPGERAS